MVYFCHPFVRFLCQIKPRSNALIYTRYVNYTYIYNLHPGVKICLLRVHMFLKSFGLNHAKIL